MAFVPQSYVKLLNVPIDANGVNQVLFTSVAAQTSYFNSRVLKVSYDFTYQRKDDVIRFPDHIDNLWNVNYVMYENSNFSNKWFYAFVTDRKYVSDKCTELTIKTDVFQTWFLSCTLKSCFIVREHQRGDNVVGVNQVDENLEIGEYTNYNGVSKYSDLQNLKPVVMTSIVNPNDSTIWVSEPNGIPSCLSFIKFNDMDGLLTWLTSMNQAAKMDAIVSILLIPAIFCGDYLLDPEYAQTNLFDTSHKTFTLPAVTIPATISGYTPKNKKLYQYPYNFLHVFTNDNGFANYRWEHFLDRENAVFQVDGGVMPNMVVKMSPKNYKKLSVNYEESISIGNYPPIPFINDAFTTWIAQNAFNIPLSFAGSVLSTSVGVATGNPVAIAAGGLGIAQQMSAIYEHSIVPPQAVGNMTGSADIGTGIHTFHFSKVSITAEFAIKIDEYFSMFGYKQNKIDIPNINSRPHWNYIQTIDCNMSGNVPGEDLEELKGLFNKGLTVWHNPANIGNYLLDNTEVIQ